MRVHNFKFFKLNWQRPPSEADIIIHRCLCLFSSQSDEYACLFGKSFASYAALFPDMPANQIALHRMNAMFEAVQAYPSPPDFLYAGVSYMMDLHVPLALSTCKAVHIAYRTKLAPEFQSDYPETLRKNEPLMKSLWTTGNDKSNLKRLLKKGGPFPASVRYVFSQLQRCLKDASIQNVVASIVRLALLGNYPHCRVIAPPSRRLKIYATTNDHVLSLCNQFGPCSSHNYFYIIAEFVLSNSKATPSVWTSIRNHSKYQVYGEQVRVASDAIRSGKKPPRVVNSVAPRSWIPNASANSLLAVVGTRKKISIASQLLIPPATIARVYKAAVLCTMRSYIYSLQQAIGESAKGLLECITEGDQRKWYASLSQANAAAVQVYCHGLAVNRAVVVGTLSDRVTRAQREIVKYRTGRESLHVIICVACGTWRSKGTMVNASRSTIGVQICLPLSKDKVSCNGCNQTWGLRTVDMCGQSVRIRPKLDAAEQWVYACTRCGYTSDKIKFVGTLPVCLQCTRAPPARSRCFACVRDNRRATTPFSAMSRHTRVEFSACAEHMPKTCVNELVDIDLVRAQVVHRSSLPTRRHYMRRF